MCIRDSHIEMNAEIERDEGGKPLRLLGVDRDITDWIESQLSLIHI